MEVIRVIVAADMAMRVIRATVVGADIVITATSAEDIPVTAVVIIIIQMLRLLLYYLMFPIFLRYRRYCPIQSRLNKCYNNKDK